MRFVAFIVVTTLLLLSSATAESQHSLTMDEAASAAITYRPGNIVGAYAINGRHHFKYVFEISAPEGIWKVKVDGNSGRVLRSCLLDSLGANACQPHVRSARRSIPENAQTVSVAPASDR